MTTDDGKTGTSDGDSASSDDAGSGLSVEPVQDALAVETVDVEARGGPDNLFWATLRVQYWWALDGGRFTAKTTGYWARPNNRYSGDIYFRISSGSNSDWHRLTTQAYQNGYWNALEQELVVTGNANSASIDFHFVYDMPLGPDFDLWGNEIVRFTLSQPIISLPANNGNVSPIFYISGRGVSGATVQTCQSNVGNEIAPQVPVVNGQWSTTVNPAIALGGFNFTSRQLVNGKYSDWASPVQVTVALAAPVISSPTNGSIINELRPVFTGTGENGAQVQIRRGDGTQISNDVNVVNNRWSAALNQDLNWGLNTLIVRQKMGDVFSSDRPVTVTVLPRLLSITAPLANTDQNGQFTVSGTDGINGATVNIYSETNSANPIGTHVLTATGSWSVAVTVAPGPVSLVATQTINGAVSDRSTPRGFRIRPPKLTDPTVTYPNQAQARFSGSGYQGATVDVVIETGPAGAAQPPAVSVANGGNWETTSTNFPPGSYTLKLIQRIPNNAGGWIESEPLEHRVVRQPSAPGEVTDTTDGE